MIRRITWWVVGFLAAGMLPACGSEAHVSLPAVFSDHAVLQRDRPIPVWGKAAPGRRVTVRFAGQTKGAVADGEGRWMLRLDPVPAGGPHKLAVWAGLERVLRKDILVGDVWVCSGQSNMQFPVSGTLNAEVEVADANYPGLRLMTVPQKLAELPQDDVDARWVVCKPETVGGFSAVGYLFGRYLHGQLGVPVGLINASWGGTRIEPWTPREALALDPAFTDLLAEYDERQKKESEGDAAAKMAAYNQALKRYEQQWPAFLAGLDEADPGTRGQWQAPDANTADWQDMTLPALWETALSDLDGVVWFRRDVDAPAEWAGKDLLLRLGPIDDDDVTYFNGRKVGAVGYDQPGCWQVDRQYTVPGRLVKAGRNVLAVRVLDGGGGGGIYGKAEQMALAPVGAPAAEAISLAGAWKHKVSLDSRKTPLPVRPSPPPQGRYIGRIYNAMIAPLVPYGIAGAIWYQGESNAGEPVTYRKLFPAMIRTWRDRWGEGDFAFLFVQLANFMAPSPEPAQGGWAWLREAQAMALRLPATGMAVTIDIGDANDIHPRNKQDVGIRLALAAMKIAGGRDEVYSGPAYRSMEIVGNQARLTFAHVGSGLLAKGGELRQFAVAGVDQVFHWAQARIESARGGTVLVWSDKVARPVAVRYAWANNPAGCNLHNVEGLPASPFRTDDWPAPGGK